MKQFLTSLMVGMFLVSAGFAYAAYETAPAAPHVTGTTVKKSQVKKTAKTALKKKPVQVQVNAPLAPAPK